MRLNLGCGRAVRFGWVNVDRLALPGVDVVHDLDVTPWPFEDASAACIEALDVFEHVADIVAVMDECWRILRPRGVLAIRGPLANGPHHWIDPTHRRAFVLESFDYFCADTKRGARYAYGAGCWEKLSAELRNDNLLFQLRKLPCS